MTVNQTPGIPPQPQSAPRRLPLRWVVILGLGAAVGLLVGAAQGLAAGVFAAVVVLGVLHPIIG